MFDKLSARLAAVVEGLRGRGRLTEENIKETLQNLLNLFFFPAQNTALIVFSFCWFVDIILWLINTICKMFR
mgnify:CR=1 FL=1